MKKFLILFAHMILFSGFVGCFGLDAKISQKHYNAEQDFADADEALQEAIQYNGCSIENPRDEDCKERVNRVEKDINKQADCEEAYEAYTANPNDPGLKENPDVVACLGK